MANRPKGGAPAPLPTTTAPSAASAGSGATTEAGARVHEADGDRDGLSRLSGDRAGDSDAPGKGEPTLVTFGPLNPTEEDSECTAAVPNPPRPLAEPERSQEELELVAEADRLRGTVQELNERVGELTDALQRARARIAVLEQAAGQAAPPAEGTSEPPGLKVKDPLRLAKLHGVRAVWLGPGTYGGQYYDDQGHPHPSCSGVTPGYFPEKDVEGVHKAQFRRVS